MKNRFKLSIVCSAALMLTLGTGVLFSGNRISNVFAADEKQWTRAEVGTSLEKLREVPTEQIAGWESYDSRDYGIVTSVKNQGNSNLCWAYSTASVAETSALREGIITDPNIEIDPEGLAQTMFGYQDDPLDLHDADNPNHGKTLDREDWNKGSNFPAVALTTTRWYGLNDAGASSTPGYGTYRVENVLTCANDINKIKDLIASYGSVMFAYLAPDASQLYHYSDGESVEHASVIVGWDDTVSVSNFNLEGIEGVTQPGAWIVKNSWGEYAHENGYFYMSYQSVISNIMTYDMMDKEEYDYNYHYAGEIPFVGFSEFPAYINLSNKFSALYQAKMGTDDTVELLKGVSIGVYLPDKVTTTTATVRIYKNVKVTDGSDAFVLPATSVSKVSMKIKNTGIYTIPLQEAVELEEGEWYFIEIELSNNASMVFEEDAASNSTNDKTYYYYNGAWLNYTNLFDRDGVALIRGLTVVREDTRPGVSEFLESVNEIENASSLRERCDLIKSAFETWNTMRAKVRAQAQEEFELLLAEIEKYNSIVEVINAASSSPAQ